MIILSILFIIWVPLLIYAKATRTQGGYCIYKKGSTVCMSFVHFTKDDYLHSTHTTPDLARAELRRLVAEGATNVSTYKFCKMHETY